MLRSLLIALIAFVGTFTQGTIGFGQAIVMMLWMPSLFPYGTAIAIVQALGIFNSLSIAITMRRYIRWKTVLPLVATTLLFGLALTHLSLGWDTGFLKLLLGVFLIILSVYFLIFSKRIKLKPTVSSALFMGVLAGTGNGLFGIGGPQAVMYLMPAIQVKEAYLATTQAYFSITTGANLLLRIAEGLIGKEYLVDLGFGFLGAVAGTLLAAKAFKKIKFDYLKIAIYAFIGIDGILIVMGQLAKGV